MEDANTALAQVMIHLRFALHRHTSSAFASVGLPFYRSAIFTLAPNSKLILAMLTRSLSLISKPSFLPYSGKDHEAASP